MPASLCTCPVCYVLLGAEMPLLLGLLDLSGHKGEACVDAAAAAAGAAPSKAAVPSPDSGQLSHTSDSHDACSSSSLNSPPRLCGNDSTGMCAAAACKSPPHRCSLPQILEDTKGRMAHRSMSKGRLSFTITILATRTGIDPRRSAHPLLRSADVMPDTCCVEAPPKSTKMVTPLSQAIGSLCKTCSTRARHAACMRSMEKCDGHREGSHSNVMTGRPATSRPGNKRWGPKRSSCSYAFASLTSCHFCVSIWIAGCTGCGTEAGWRNVLHAPR